ncbi:HD domain-containing protein [Streptococcus pneumoniae]
MRKDEILKAAESYVQLEMGQDRSGHDDWHAMRVRNTAKKLAELEGADSFICELAALLHDVADEKFNPSQEMGLEKISQWMMGQGVTDSDRLHILEIVATMSFKGGKGVIPVSLEGKIVQDADRLDAIGAIGIARVMCYSAYSERPIHDPYLLPRDSMTVEEYRNGQSSAIMHFYEKLLLLKDRMNTKVAKELAQSRHEFMEMYLEQFYQEWDGKA